MQKIWKKRIWYRNQQLGFTVMELVVVIAIVGVIAAISLPALLGMRERYKLRSSATDVMSAIKRAQTEAVKRNANVGIAFDAVARTCTVFVDDGAIGGGLFNPALAKDSIQNGTEQTVFTTTIQPGNSFNSITFPPSPPNILEFNSRGIPTNACSPPGPAPPLPPCYVNVISPTNSVLQYQITLNVTGHTNLLVSTDSGTTFH